MNKTITIRTKLLFLSLLFFSIAGLPTLQAQETTSSPHWTVKLNLLSPVWKNVSGEIEYKFKKRLSLVAGAGVSRAFESLPERTGWECTESRGFGLAAGMKYFLFHKESRNRSVDGIALKTTLNYTFDDEFRQICPSLLPLELNRSHTFGINAFLSVQKTFLDRIVVEAQAGIGGSMQRILVSNSEVLAIYRDRTVFFRQIPFALNVGWTF